MRPATFVLLTSLAVSPGCLYRIGQNLAAGVFDEAGGGGKTRGLEGVTERIAERHLAEEIGRQLGEGLASGATDLTPEQRAALEEAIDGWITVASQRAGTGLRDEVSPALRDMVRRDIVDALAQGMRHEIGPTLEETVDQVVTRAILSLRRGVSDAETKQALADLIRTAVFKALREKEGDTPGIGTALEATLSENVLPQLEGSAESVSTLVAKKVAEERNRTENQLKGIIFLVALIASVFLIMYMIAQRQLSRERVRASTTAAEKRSLDAAIGLLDEEAKARVLEKLDEYRSVMAIRPPKGETPPPANRRDDYLRK